MNNKFAVFTLVFLLSGAPRAWGSVRTIWTTDTFPGNREIIGIVGDKVVLQGFATGQNCAIWNSDRGMCPEFSTFSATSGERLTQFTVDKALDTGKGAQGKIGKAILSSNGSRGLLTAFTERTSGALYTSVKVHYLFLDLSSGKLLKSQSNDFLSNRLLEPVDVFGTPDRHLVQCHSGVPGPDGTGQRGMTCISSAIDWENLTVTPEQTGQTVSTELYVQPFSTTLLPDSEGRQFFVKTGTMGWLASTQDLKVSNPLRKGDSQTMYDASFSPDGAKLIVTDWDSLRVFDTASGQEVVHVPTPHPMDPAHEVRFIDGSKGVASFHGHWSPWAGGDFTVRFWELDRKELTETAEFHFDTAKYSYPSSIWLNPANKNDLVLVKGGWTLDDPFVLERVYLE